MKDECGIQCQHPVAQIGMCWLAILASWMASWHGAASEVAFI